MKRLYRFIIVSVVIILAGNGQQLWAEEHVQINLETIKLKSVLTENIAISQEFEYIATEFSEYFKKKLYNSKFISEMVEFIKKYPFDHTFLSAKYYLATYLMESREKFALDDYFLWLKITEDAIEIFQEIARESPDSWQGKLSSLFTRELFIILGSDDKEAILREMRKSLAVVIEIKDSPQFLKLQERMGKTKPIELQVRSQLLTLELEQGNIENAKKELLLIRENYPKEKTEHLEEKISIVHQRQIEKKKSLE